MELQMTVGFVFLGLLVVIQTFLGVMQSRYLARMNEKLTADDAAIYLQGRRVEEILKEMRDSLKAG